MKDDRIDAAVLRIKKAREMVSALCHGERSWTMSVPADAENDPDLVIADGLKAGSEMAEALRATPAVNGVPAELVDRAIEAWFGEPLDWQEMHLADGYRADMLKVFEVIGFGAAQEAQRAAPEAQRPAVSGGVPDELRQQIITQFYAYSDLLRAAVRNGTEASNFRLEQLENGFLALLTRPEPPASSAEAPRMGSGVDAVEVLRELEWSGSVQLEDDWIAACPICGSADINGHTPDCHLAAAIRFPASRSEVDRLAARIEQIAMQWRGANGGIFTIHAMALEMAQKLADVPRVGSGVDERLAFENWAERDHRRLEALEHEEREPSNNHFYAVESTNEAYIGWCARAALSQNRKGNDDGER